MKRLPIMIMMLCAWGLMLQAQTPVLDSKPAAVSEVNDSIEVVMLSSEHLQQLEMEQGDTLPEMEEELVEVKPAIKDTISMAIMLPFQTDTQKPTEAQARFVDFYTGALIAIYEAQKAGKYITLYTYDVGKTAQGVQNVMESEEWKKVDGIIGLAYEQQVQKALEYAVVDSTWILAPFTSNLTYEQDYNYVFQFNSTDNTHAEVFANYLSKRADSVNCVFVQPQEGEVIPSSVAALRAAVQRYEVPTTTPTLQEILHDSLKYYLVEGSENIIIFNTEKFKNLSTVIPHLELCCNDSNNLTLFSRYSWVKNAINVPQIYTCIFSNNGGNSSGYKRLYKRFFVMNPKSSYPRYDLLGYDLIKQFITILSNPTKEQIEEVYDGIQSKVRYRRSFDHAGYENRMVRIIRK